MDAAERVRHPRSKRRKLNYQNAMRSEEQINTTMEQLPEATVRTFWVVAFLCHNPTRSSIRFPQLVVPVA
jgi:aspartate/tyrosine/aromatic aminotransferase|eukprot:scaffold261_cov318-Chaetoceros_neogracile.AAC.1